MTAGIKSWPRALHRDCPRPLPWPSPAGSRRKYRRPAELYQSKSQIELRGCDISGAKRVWDSREFWSVEGRFLILTLITGRLSTQWYQNSFGIDSTKEPRTTELWAQSFRASSTRLVKRLFPFCAAATCKTMAISGVGRPAHSWILAPLQRAGTAPRSTMVVV